MTSQHDLKDVEQLRGLLDEITKDPSMIDKLPEADLARLENLVSPYSFALKADTSADDAHLVFGFTNLREKYMKHLLATSMVGYLYRRCDEYGRLYKDRPTYMDDMKAAEAEIIENQKRLPALTADLVAKIKERDELEARVAADAATEKKNRDQYDATKTMMTTTQILEMREFMHQLVDATDRLRLLNKAIDALHEEREAIQAHGKRYIIREFLDEQFRFNPDRHVRSSYVTRASTDPTAAVISRFVPPDDFFHNYTYYLDSNYEELSGVTRQLYRIVPDLEVALQAHGVFPTKKEAQKFIDVNTNKVAHDLRSVALGSWAVLPAYKANRDSVLVGQGTIIADILAQNEADHRAGAAIARKRVEKARTDTLKKSGPPPKQVADYMAAQGTPDPTAIESKMTVDEQAAIFKAAQEEKRAYESALVAPPTEEAAPDDLLRVNVYTMLDGGAATAKSHFFVPSEEPDPQHPPIVRQA